MLQELITDKDDIALEMSVKEYKDLVKFSKHIPLLQGVHVRIHKANFLVDFPTGEIKFETKVFLKTTIEDKIRSLIKV